MKAKFILSLALLIGCGTASSAGKAWQRVPDLGHDDIEAATPYRHRQSTGASVVSSEGIMHPEMFISHDPTDSAKLNAGESEVTLSLGHQEVIHGISFANDAMEGCVTAQASPDRKNWMDLGQTTFTPADAWPKIEFAGSQVKYVKLRFALTSRGTLRNFQIFGSDTDQDFDLAPAESSGESTEVNLADGLGGTRVVYVHPTPLKTTGAGTHHVYHQPFNFPESDEKYRTVIYDLGRERKLKSFGSVHSPRPVRLSVYLFTSLEEKEDWRGRMMFDPAVFDKATPAAVIEDRKGTGAIKVELDTATPARYVAIRWEPEFNPPAFTVDGVLIASRGWSLVPHGAGGTTGEPVTTEPTPQTFAGSFGPFGWSSAGYAGGGDSLPTANTITTTTNTGTNAPPASP